MTYEEEIADLRQKIAQITSNPTNTWERRDPFTVDTTVEKFDSNDNIIASSHQKREYELVSEWDTEQQKWVEKEVVQVWP